MGRRAPCGVLGLGRGPMVGMIPVEGQHTSKGVRSASTRTCASPQVKSPYKKILRSNSRWPWSSARPHSSGRSRRDAREPTPAKELLFLIRACSARRVGHAEVILGGPRDRRSPLAPLGERPGYEFGTRVVCYYVAETLHLHSGNTDNRRRLACLEDDRGCLAFSRDVPADRSCSGPGGGSSPSGGRPWCAASASRSVHHPGQPHGMARPARLPCPNCSTSSPVAFPSAWAGRQ